MCLSGGREEIIRDPRVATQSVGCLWWNFIQIAVTSQEVWTGFPQTLENLENKPHFVKLWNTPRECFHAEKIMKFLDSGKKLVNGGTEVLL